jgi:MFS family permease
VVLLLAQVAVTSATVLLVTVGGLVGSTLAPSPALTTLPVSLMIVGTALATVPAALLMQRFGRRAGFSGAAVVGAGGALLAMAALAADAFWPFCVAAVLIGATAAFGQQFRFAAAESVAPERASRAVSLILLGSVGGALLGPEFVARSPGLDPAHPFRFAFAALAVLLLAAAGLLALLRPTAVAQAASEAPDEVRPLGRLLRAPLFAVAVLGGVVGQGTMTFLMTATPVSMHVVDGHDLAATAGVIRAHVLAMYLPSLVSGTLIARFGARPVMAVGLAAMAATVVTGSAGNAVGHYSVALVLLGIGWNFLYVGGTTLLVGSYRPAERFRAQGFNDACVFGTAALASLLGGALLLRLGWGGVLTLAVPVLVLMAGVLLASARTRVRAPA